jgi:two-component system cell cycle response regulator CpdR
LARNRFRLPKPRLALETDAPFGHKFRSGRRIGCARAARHETRMIRILLAEDDGSMRGYLARALERAGYNVTPVDCGSQALPLLEAEHFDLLLTDIVMPEMDGIELAQKAAGIAPDMRIMFITGFAAVALKAGKAAPAAKVLSKPFHLRDLVAEVDRLFQSEDQHGRL